MGFIISSIVMLIIFALMVIYLRNKYDCCKIPKWIIIHAFMEISLVLIIGFMQYRGISLYNIIIMGLVISLLYGIAIIDLKLMKIDKYLLLGLLLVAVGGLFRDDYIAIADRLVAMIFFGVVMLIIAKISKAIGMGDVKLIAVLSLLSGVKLMFSIMIYSLFIGLIAGIIRIITIKVNMKTELPFAPFLFVGTILSIIFQMR